MVLWGLVGKDPGQGAPRVLVPNLGRPSRF